MMNRPPLAWLLAMGISLVCARAADTSPFALNGWQFHDYNMPKLEEAVRRAPEYGVNFLIFSHEFFRSPEGFLASTDDFDPRNPPAYLKDLKPGRPKGPSIASLPTTRLPSWNSTSARPA